MSINELQDEVIAEFSDFDDWMDRYQLLIDLGNEQEPLDEKYKTEQNLIEGCQSRVWLQADDVDGKIVFDRSKCTACGVCTDWCITEARELAGKEYTVDALVKEAMKDKIFYEQSGGGVTLSGGEVMASQHMDYVEEVCRKLHENGVSVFIDTSGYTDYENLKRILPYVDVFLYDIKVMDPEGHKKYIGVDNSLILENLKKLSDEGAGLYIRLPIIQQVNATDEHIESVIHFLKENNIHARQVNLLPYHDIGKGKYASLDMEYHEDEMSVPVSELMEHFKSMFEEQGFNKVNIGG